MPSTISFRRAASIRNRARCGASALVTGCCGAPANIARSSVRHQSSRARATAGSPTSSTVSSTSRQKA